MNGGETQTLAKTPKSVIALAVILALIVVYAVLQVAFVRPYLPPDPSPNFARAPVSAGESEQALRAWREAYHAGPAAAWQHAHPAAAPHPDQSWARTHLGMILQIVVFTGAAIVLFFLRSSDPTAALVILALGFAGVAGGGPLLGAERVLPAGASILTVFAWLGTPLAFPMIALAILYFPTPSPWVKSHPILHVVPIIAALPLLVPATASALYLTGVDSLAPIARWDAAHPRVFFGSFAVALGLNVSAVFEALHRYGANRDANERRRIRMAVYTAVPGVLAYAIKQGGPIVAQLLDRSAPVYPFWLSVLLQGLVVLPAFGAVYVVGVSRVLGPRVVLRRSLQYALANRTLAVLPFLPLAALLLALFNSRDKTIAEAARGAAGLDALLLAVALVVWTYRHRARHWLDQRFFREEYDARKILLSLANRVRFETDPMDLATMVVTQIDEALHPEMTAILVNGIEEGRLTPVTVLHGSAESLPHDGGLASMLKWSDEPLEIFFGDPRSPVNRLPPEEREWLECVRAALLVPVAGAEGTLAAVIALGAKRSEEAYTGEDKQLLASIAAQMGLGLDVVRLRSSVGSSARTDSDETTRAVTPALQPMMECPKCGRCEDSGTTACPSDGNPMQSIASVSRVIDNKYRIDQLIGRGGMGAVYRARDMRLDRLVALKVVRADLLGDAEAKRRFRREAQIIASLQHPSIVSVFDYGTFADGGAYLVMELVRGEDLRHVLQREGRLDPARALRILTAVCSAMEAAHREGVLHRDLKPENILLPTREVEAKVLDFGVAKVIDERADPGTTAGGSLVTAAGMIIGTPAYMAPEQLHGLAADPRTDVFSLGVIAFEMMTGELPFGRGSLADIVLAHAHGLTKLPATNLPPDLIGAIRSALNPDADKRPPSAQAFARLLASAH